MVCEFGDPQPLVPPPITVNDAGVVATLPITGVGFAITGVGFAITGVGFAITGVGFAITGDGFARRYSFDLVEDAEDGHIKRHNHAADDSTDHRDHERLDQGREGLGSGLHLCLVELGDLVKHGLQGT